MKIVNFQGGLGNQIFIYLFANWLQSQNPNERIYGAYWSGSLKAHSNFMLDKVFNVSLPPRSILTDYISKIAFWLERHNLVSTEEGKHSIFYNGFWLDKMYFGNYRQRLQFRHLNLSASNSQYKKEIEGSCSCSIHVRRGDYQNPENKRNFGDYCTLDYYDTAVNELKRKCQCNIKFFVFSDDIHWAKCNLSLDDAVFINGNEGNNSWLDLYLMSICHHNIIANSTFSFWAAMLNKHADKIVIYPKKWFIWENPDIFPKQWFPL